MVDPKTGYLIIFLVILGIVIINYGIIRQFTRKGSSDIELLSKTIQTVRDPWKKEDQDLDELARLVEKAKKLEKDGKSEEEINEDNETSNL